METDDFSTFGKFNSKDEALAFADLLTDNSIEYLLEDHSVAFDSIFEKNKLEDEFRIKIKGQDFVKVETLLNRELDGKKEETEKSYYLFDFSDQELMNVVAKSDEWSQFDFDLAQWILKERGKEVRPEVVMSLKKRRIEQLSKPEGYSTVWIYLGYISALFGGLLGIIIGWHLIEYKKKLPNGERVYGYIYQVRNHGRRIVFICVISLMIFTAYSIIY